MEKDEEAMEEETGHVSRGQLGQSSRAGASRGAAKSSGRTLPTSTAPQQGPRYSARNSNKAPTKYFETDESEEGNDSSDNYKL